MLFSHVVIYTVYTLLENRKISLNRICADKHIVLFASVHLPRMANNAETAEMLVESAMA
jgi:hypothetical protein